MKLRHAISLLLLLLVATITWLAVGGKYNINPLYSVGQKIEIIQQKPGSYGPSRKTLRLRRVKGRWEIGGGRFLGWLGRGWGKKCIYISSPMNCTKLSNNFYLSVIAS